MIYGILVPTHQPEQPQVKLGAKHTKRKRGQTQKATNMSTAGIIALVDRATADMEPTEAAMFIEDLMDQLSARHREFDQTAADEAMNYWWKKSKGEG